MQNYTKKRFVKSIIALSFVLLISLIVFIIGISLKSDTQRKMQEYTLTTSVVIGYEKNITDEYNIIYAEIVEFTVNGKSYTAVNNRSSSVPAEIGAELEIYYDPNNPENYMFASSSKFAANIILIVAIILLAITIILIVKNSIAYRNSSKEELSEQEDMS